MTLTIDNQISSKLLEKYQLKVITTEEENEQAIAVVEKLSNQPDLNTEEEQLLELLITLIEKFESEQYPLANLSTPLSRLRFLMESNNLCQADLVDILGSEEMVSETLDRQGEISKENALKLGAFFNLNPALFI